MAMIDPELKAEMYIQSKLLRLAHVIVPGFD